MPSRPKCRKCRAELEPAEVSTPAMPLAGPGLCNECYAKDDDDRRRAASCPWRSPNQMKEAKRAV